MMKNEDIKLENVSKVYTRKEKGFILSKKTREKILEDINISIQPGVVTGVIGSSGSGKTILANLLALTEKPTEGKLYYGDEDTSKFTAKRLKTLKKEIGFIVQDAHIMIDLEAKASDVIGGPKTAKKKNDAEAPSDNGNLSAVKAVMSQVGLNAEHYNRKAVEFSGGQRQLLTIAGGMINHPRFIIADQPLNALDPQSKRNIAGLFRQFAHQEKKTVILIAHQLEIVSQFTDQLIILDHGKVIETGDTKTVFSRPQHEKTKTLIGLHHQYMDLPSILTQKRKKSN